MLAKYKKEWIIKYGIMGILFIALLYANVPLAHQIMVDDSVTPFEYDSNEKTNATYLTEIGMDQYIDSMQSYDSGELINTVRLMQWGVDEPVWTTEFVHGAIVDESVELVVVPVQTPSPSPMVSQFVPFLSQTVQSNPPINVLRLMEMEMYNPFSNSVVR